MWSGELIASEIEVRTGRCESVRAGRRRHEERRPHSTASHASADRTGRHRNTSVEPWQDQRIIDTPHYRRNDELLRYVVWRNNTFGIHVHVGIRGADRAIAVHDALRNFLPEFLALSASSPFVEAVNSGLHSARTEIFTRMFPRCGIPDAYGTWQGWEDYVGFLYRTGSITEHTQIWWSVRPHLAYPTIEIRICDGNPTSGRRSRSPRSATRSRRVVRVRTTKESRSRTSRTASSRRTSGARSATGSPASCWTSSAVSRFRHARGSSAPRLGRAGRRRDRCRVLPRLPDRNAAERQIARCEDGASLEEIYAEQVRAGEPIGG